MTDKPENTPADGWPGWLAPPVDFGEVTWVGGGPYPPVQWVGHDAAEPGSDRTVTSITIPVSEPPPSAREAFRIWADAVMQMLPPADPAPTESETALHRAVLATRREGQP